MTTFDVKDMTCNHCVRAITDAVHQVDAKATVNIDLPTHRVQVDSTDASPEAIRKAIEDAGYMPVGV